MPLRLEVETMLLDSAEAGMVEHMTWGMRLGAALSEDASLIMCCMSIQHATNAVMAYGVARLGG